MFEDAKQRRSYVSDRTDRPFARMLAMAGLLRHQYLAPNAVACRPVL